MSKSSLGCIFTQISPYSYLIIVYIIHTKSLVWNIVLRFLSSSSVTFVIGNIPAGKSNKFHANHVHPAVGTSWKNRYSWKCFTTWVKLANNNSYLFSLNAHEWFPYLPFLVRGLMTLAGLTNQCPHHSLCLDTFESICFSLPLRQIS